MFRFHIIGGDYLLGHLAISLLLDLSFFGCLHSQFRSFALQFLHELRLLGLERLGEGELEAVEVIERQIVHINGDSLGALDLLILLGRRGSFLDEILNPQVVVKLFALSDSLRGSALQLNILVGFLSWSDVSVLSEVSK